MKQRITVEQLNELTDDQQARLKLWWVPTLGDYIKLDGQQNVALDVYDTTYGLNKIMITWQIDGDCTSSSPKDDCLPLLSIGQMIEYLENPTMEYDGDWVVTDGHRGNTAFDKELCDALFKLLNQILDLK